MKNDSQKQTLVTSEIKFDEFGQYGLTEIFDDEALSQIAGGNMNIVCVPVNNGCIPLPGNNPPPPGEDGDYE